MLWHWHRIYLHRRTGVTSPIKEYAHCGGQGLWVWTLLLQRTPARLPRVGLIPGKSHLIPLWICLVQHSTTFHRQIHNYEEVSWTAPYSLTVYMGLLLLLLSRFGRVRLCATPQTAAHQAPPSMGFSRQEYWSGVPLPSPCWVIRQFYFQFFKESPHCSP